MLEVNFTRFSSIVHLLSCFSPASQSKPNLLKIYVRQGFKEAHLSCSIKANGKWRRKGLKCMTSAAVGLHVLQLSPIREQLKRSSFLFDPVAEMLNSPVTPLTYELPKSSTAEHRQRLHIEKENNACKALSTGLAMSLSSLNVHTQ